MSNMDPFQVQEHIYLYKHKHSSVYIAKCIKLFNLSALHVLIINTYIIYTN